MNDIPYYDARVRAAEKDPAFESRQGAGAVIMGITTDEELQQALNETRIDIALFVERPSKEGAA